MKRNIHYIIFNFFLLLTGFMFIVSPPVLAQGEKSSEKKWTIKTGFGYYNPMTTSNKGNIFYAEAGYTLPTGFSVGAGFGLSDVFYEYTDVPLFEGFPSIHNYYHLKLHLDKEFILDRSGKHLLNVGTGITYIQKRYAEPEVYLVPVRNEMGEITAYELQVSLHESNRLQDEAGMFISADYSYMFGSIGIGLHVETHFLYDIGLGGLIVAPQITARF